MNVFCLFGIGASRILAQNHHTQAVVTHVRKSGLHTVKKPVRLYNHAGNTLYSHIITFQYTVDCIPYTGYLFVDLRFRCPQVGESLDVYYDPQKPGRYALYLFGSQANPIGW